MKLQHKALLYDIANMAYVIADTHDHSNHSLHRVRDITEEGNRDRVARVTGAAYATILCALSPIIRLPKEDIGRDVSVEVRDLHIRFKDNEDVKFNLTKEKRLKIKETAHEYIVSRVLADWLEVTLPEASDVWKYRAEESLDILKDIASDVASAGSCAFRRRISPF